MHLLRVITSTEALSYLLIFYFQIFQVLFIVHLEIALFKFALYSQYFRDIVLFSEEDLETNSLILFKLNSLSFKECLLTVHFL
jgi:hypothetical protein